MPSGEPHRRRTPTYTDHDGFRMPRGFPPESFASGLAYRARPGDLFVTAYPKCGSTWTLHIVWLLLHDGAPLGADDKLSLEMPHLEEMGREFVERKSSPRIIKTHLPYHLTPRHPETKYIYITRNPFDCVVSFFHHTRGFVELYDFEHGTFDDFFECFIAGETDFGDYFDNLLSWSEHMDDANLLFLTYERLEADPRHGVVSVADFLGPGCAELVRDPSKLAEVLHHSSFASMSQEQQRWSSRRPDHLPPFVRRGRVGEWVSALTPEQAARLAAKFRARTKDTRVAGLWPDTLRRAERGPPR
jgi:hypothetical protein